MKRTDIIILIILIPSCHTLPAQDEKAKPEFSEIAEEYYATDIGSLISMDSEKSIIAKRFELIRFIWGPPGMPSQKYPADVQKDFQDERYHTLQDSGLERIDYVSIGMDFDLQSNIYHFIPQNGNHHLVLFHQGHGGDFIKNRELIAELLQSGYGVAAFCMPLLGLNNQPTVHLPRFGYLKIAKHDHLKFLTSENGHPVKCFIEPIFVFLNYALSEFNYSDVAMVGISGGGWTTTLAAAVETRIRYSFPVAGTYPIYLRSNSNRDWGDYEQTIPELYRVSNYLELYILGAHGENRRQLQILNQYDSCCFAGIKWQTYYTPLKNHIAKLGKTDWDLFMDDSHTEHKISPVARARIMSALRDM